MNTAYSVYPYTIEKLKELLGGRTSNIFKQIENKLHFVYLEEYFRSLNAKTVIVEEEYVDKDFLEDYAAYYVRCFYDYNRKCRRLHFFSKTLLQGDFEALLSGTGQAPHEERLHNSYLGFIVLKPLPQTIIGRTCLKTYGNDNGRRHYCVTREFRANLFGLQFDVNTLPFQEQDSVVAACATSALWSAFHGSGFLFQHAIPSPVEITKMATAQLPMETRSLPNSGLTAAQMAGAIRMIGLEPFLVNTSDHYVLKSTLYAYLRGGIPTLLGIHLIDLSNAAGKPKNGEYFGSHAVAVTGFSLGRKKPKPYQKNKKSTGLLLKASRIDKIYVHDDQVGPFARMGLDQERLKYSIDDKAFCSESIATSWVGKNNQIGSVGAVSELMLIPLYHKIRIPFGTIHDHIVHLDAVINELSLIDVIQLTERPEWDIYLTSVNDFKKEVLSSASYVNHRNELLTTSLPRFLWKASAYCREIPIIELLFDATDIEQASFLSYIVPFDLVLVNSIISVYSKLDERTRRMPELNVVGWLVHKFKEIFHT